MALTVTERNEILLNGQKYHTKGPVLGSFQDPFPSQMTIGDVSYGARLHFSSWVMDDFREGIGVEEMDEKTDSRRTWWTDCITKYRGHLLPPRKATAITAPTSTTAAAIANGDMELAASWTGGARSSTQAHGGTYSWLLDDATTSVTQAATTWTNDWRSRRFTFVGWVYLTADANPRLGINDGIATTEGTAKNTLNAWDALMVTRVLAATATQLQVQLLRNAGSPGENAYFDDVAIYSPVPTSTVKFAHFNGNLYASFGNRLMKLNATRDGWTDVGTFPVKDLIPFGTSLYIYLGDVEGYVVMTTGEAFSISTTTAATFGFHYDNKLFKSNATGTVAYSSNPAANSPTWTSGGAVNADSDIQGFVVGRDADGTQVPYCSTQTRIKVYDSATPAWIETEVVLPNHPNGGKGFAYYNAKLYFSYGLSVKEYYPETGSLIDMGLNKRDGLPVEYNGEIMRLYGDSNEGMFCLIDASQVSGAAKSGLYVYDGFGWHCWWIDTSDDRVMTDVIVSSAASAYAVYWNTNMVVSYIDIPRGIDNPDKISQSYATAGTFITPWFDAGDQTIAKLAKVLADFAKGVTTTETVALKYRIDHANTDLDTGWTTLDTLNTAAESGYNKELWASGAGLAFKAIQFRLDFVTGGSTAKADIESLVLHFKKLTGGEKLRFWTVTIVLDDYGGTTAQQKVTNLKNAITSITDVVFSYHPNDNAAESFYVSVDGQFSEETGRDYSGVYELRLIEV